MFNADGLTIIYRESPATLDKAMPLNLYTDMYHYVVLSRCGMVICKNVSTKDAAAVLSATANYAGVANASGWKMQLDDKQKTEALATLKANRMLTLGAIAYYQRTGHDPKEFAALQAALDQK